MMKNTNIDNTEIRESMRSEALKLRENLSHAERGERSRRITFHVVEWIQNRNKLDDIPFHSVMVYLSMNSEVKTEELIERFIKQGKRIIAPEVNTKRTQLIPRLLQNLETDLERHNYGMLQPKSTCPIIPHDQIELIIVPGIAFDLKGYRLGFGKGFYDRFLPACPNARTIGLAFQLQIVEDTFPQPWDVPVQHIFTETGMV